MNKRLPECLTKFLVQVKFDIDARFVLARLRMMAALFPVVYPPKDARK